MIVYVGPTSSCFLLIIILVYVGLVSKGYFEHEHESAKARYEGPEPFDRKNKGKVYPPTIHKLLKRHEDDIANGKVDPSRKGVYPFIQGAIKLRRGRLEDPVHREFLSKDVTKAYLNNYNGVFAERSDMLPPFLDAYNAALFAMMKPGAVMVTFHPLDLGSPRSEINKHRKLKGLEESDDAGFFEMETIALGRANNSVKWCRKSGDTTVIKVYKYTRLDQPSYKNKNVAVWMCTNPMCNNAYEPELATKRHIATMKDGNKRWTEERLVIHNNTECSCAKGLRNLRKKRGSR
jgi:hypothetical protein